MYSICGIINFNERAVELTCKNGICPYAFVMLGMPGETYVTIEESVRLCKRLGYQAEFSITSSIPDSQLFIDTDRGEISSLKKLVENWGNRYEILGLNL